MAIKKKRLAGFARFKQNDKSGSAQNMASGASGTGQNESEPTKNEVAAGKKKKLTGSVPKTDPEASGSGTGQNESESTQNEAAAGKKKKLAGSVQTTASEASGPDQNELSTQNEEAAGKKKKLAGSTQNTDPEASGSGQNESEPTQISVGARKASKFSMKKPFTVAEPLSFNLRGEKKKVEKVKKETKKKGKEESK